MFGNLLGWAISAIIAAGAGLMGFFLVHTGATTPPTGWVQTTVKPLEMEPFIKAAMDPMDGKDDAGPLYRQAIEDYDRHVDSYVQMQTTREFDDAQMAELKGFDLMVKAAACPTMNLFESHPEEIVGFNSEVEVLTKLEVIVKAMENAILLAKDKDAKRYDLAHKYANAILALGYHLYKERVAYIELSAGEEDIGKGNDSLTAVDKASNAGGKNAAAETILHSKRLDELKAFQEVNDVISGQSDEDISTHAGDMFQIAADSSIDRVWRVEAIRKIARLQLNSPQGEADQKKAKRVLAQMAAESKDPVIKAAATKASSITASDNQSQR